MTRAACVLLVVFCASDASAQLLAAKDSRIVYGHHHIAASDIPAHLKFFADTLGGTTFKFGPQQVDVVRFPNVFIYFRSQKPTGGTKGTTVNHIGFSVTNLRQTLDRVKAAGYAVVTRTEVDPSLPVVDDIAVTAAKRSIAFVMGPDDVKVELLENRQQAMPIALHHVHFFGQQNTAMRDWYVKVFGARARDGGAFPAADLPGVALNFSPSTEAVIGTSGRSLDHIGFEVRDLEAFCKTLEAMGITLSVSYRKVEAMGLAVAFVTDPWGTSIELNEGLAKLP